MFNWISAGEAASSYILLAVVTVALGIFLVIELSAEWLGREKLAAVPFLLAAIPFYNFLGLKFDQNSALIPLWALATWAFVRSLERRHLGWAALAGIAAAAAMLVKYWSAFLLLALATIRWGLGGQLRLEHVRYTYGSFPVYGLAAVAALFHIPARFKVTRKDNEDRPKPPVLAGITALALFAILLLLTPLAVSCTLPADPG